MQLYYFEARQLRKKEDKLKRALIGAIMRALKPHFKETGFARFDKKKEGNIRAVFYDRKDKDGDRVGYFPVGYRSKWRKEDREIYGFTDEKCIITDCWMSIAVCKMENLTYRDLIALYSFVQKKHKK